MYYKFTLFIFFLISTFSHASQECRPVKGTDIYYLNGINTKIGTAAENERRVRQLFPDHRVRNAYVSTDGSLMKDVFEAVLQRLDVSARPELAGLKANTILKEAWFWLEAPRGAPRLPGSLILPKLVSTALHEEIGIANNEMIVEKNKILLENIASQPDIPDHLNLYNESLESDRNIVLLGHSQGSIYANYGHKLLTQNPDYKSRVGTFLSGAVVGNLAGDSQTNGYFTYTYDYIMLAMKAAVWTTLPGNVDRGRLFGNNHSFKDYYGSTKEPDDYPIREWGRQIIEFARISGNLDKEICVDKPEPEPEPELKPIACGGVTNVSGDGSGEGMKRALVMGSEPGVVWGTFTAFCKKDKLTIKDSNGEILYSTRGFVGETHQIMFRGFNSEVHHRFMLPQLFVPRSLTAWAS